MKRLLRNGVVKRLPPDYDVDTHFKPSYEPWDQRLCFVPDGDLFESLAQGRAVDRHRPHSHVHRARAPARVGR